MIKFTGNPQRLKTIIDLAILEDDCRRDVTTNSLISSAQTASAVITLNQEAVVSGLFLVKMILGVFDKKARVQLLAHDGKLVKKNTVVVRINAKAHAILKAERVILNFLSHLSGISTKSHQAMNAVSGISVSVLDTRKTTPGLRDLEKYAVRCGGVHNHRLSLSDMAMIKDNHYLCLRNLSLKEAVGKIQKKARKKVEVEVENFQQLKDALVAKADIILLDNMSVASLKKCVKFVKEVKGKNRPLLEASGGITLKNLRQFAQTGVDRISLGALTHSADAVNISLDIQS